MSKKVVKIPFSLTFLKERFHLRFMVVMFYLARLSHFAFGHEQLKKKKQQSN